MTVAFMGAARWTTRDASPPSCWRCANSRATPPRSTSPSSPPSTRNTLPRRAAPPRRGEPADGGVAGEPTGLRVVSASKGCVRWEIEVKGRAAHSSRPEEGIDAIAIGADLVRHLRDVFAPRLAVRSHPLLGQPSLVCSLIQGGEGINTVPARCSLKFDRRTLPSETSLEAWSEIDGEVRRFAAGSIAAPP